MKLNNHKFKMLTRVTSMVLVVLMIFSMADFASMIGYAATQTTTEEVQLEEPVQTLSATTTTTPTSVNYNDGNHHHTFACYEQWQKVCGYENGELDECGQKHYHTFDCFTHSGSLVCDKQEGAPEHEHTSACEVVAEVYICGHEGHEHNAKCIDPDYGKTPARYVYYLNFDPNGGEGGPTRQVQESNDTSATFTIPEGKPIRSGYRCTGWLDKDTNTAYHAGDTIIVTEGRPDVRLYAIWEYGEEDITDTNLPQTSGSESRYYCDKQEHEHTSDCVYKVYVCGEEESQVEEPVRKPQRAPQVVAEGDVRIPIQATLSWDLKSVSSGLSPITEDVIDPVFSTDLKGNKNINMLLTFTVSETIAPGSLHITFPAIHGSYGSQGSSSVYITDQDTLYLSSPFMAKGSLKSLTQSFTFTGCDDWLYTAYPFTTLSNTNVIPAGTHITLVAPYRVYYFSGHPGMSIPLEVVVQLDSNGESYSESLNVSYTIVPTHPEISISQQNTIDTVRTPYPVSTPKYSGRIYEWTDDLYTQYGIDKDMFVHDILSRTYGYVFINLYTPQHVAAHRNIHAYLQDSSAEIVSVRWWESTLTTFNTSARYKFDTSCTSSEFTVDTHMPYRRDGVSSYNGAVSCAIILKVPINSMDNTLNFKGTLMFDWSFEGATDYTHTTVEISHSSPTDWDIFDGHKWKCLHSFQSSSVDTSTFFDALDMGKDVTVIPDVYSDLMYTQAVSSIGADGCLNLNHYNITQFMDCVTADTSNGPVILGPDDYSILKLSVDVVRTSAMGSIVGSIEQPRIYAISEVEEITCDNLVTTFDSDQSVIGYRIEIPTSAYTTRVYVRCTMELHPTTKVLQIMRDKYESISAHYVYFAIDTNGATTTGPDNVASPQSERQLALDYYSALDRGYAICSTDSKPRNSLTNYSAYVAAQAVTPNGTVVANTGLNAITSPISDVLLSFAGGIGPLLYNPDNTNNIFEYLNSVTGDSDLECCGIRVYIKLPEGVELATQRPGTALSEQITGHSPFYLSASQRSSVCVDRTGRYECKYGQAGGGYSVDRSYWHEYYGGNSTYGTPVGSWTWSESELGDRIYSCSFEYDDPAIIRSWLRSYTYISGVFGEIHLVPTNGLTFDAGDYEIQSVVTLYNRNWDEIQIPPDVLDYLNHTEAQHHSLFDAVKTENKIGLVSRFVLDPAGMTTNASITVSQYNGTFTRVQFISPFENDRDLRYRVQYRGINGEASGVVLYADISQEGTYDAVVTGIDVSEVSSSIGVPDIYVNYAHPNLYQWESLQKGRSALEAEEDGWVKIDSLSFDDWAKIKGVAFNFGDSVVHEDEILNCYILWDTPDYFYPDADYKASMVSGLYMSDVHHTIESTVRTNTCITHVEIGNPASLKVEKQVGDTLSELNEWKYGGADWNNNAFDFDLRQQAVPELDFGDSAYYSYKYSLAGAIPYGVKQFVVSDNLENVGSSEFNGEPRSLLLYRISDIMERDADGFMPFTVDIYSSTVNSTPELLQGGGLSPAFTKLGSVIYDGYESLNRYDFDEGNGATWDDSLQSWVCEKDVPARWGSAWDIKDICDAVPDNTNGNSLRHVFDLMKTDVPRDGTNATYSEIPIALYDLPEGTRSIAFVITLWPDTLWGYPEGYEPASGRYIEDDLFSEWWSGEDTEDITSRFAAMVLMQADYSCGGTDGGMKTTFNTANIQYWAGQHETNLNSDKTTYTVNFKQYDWSEEMPESGGSGMIPYIYLSAATLLTTATILTYRRKRKYRNG